MKTVDEIVRNMREFADGQENNSALSTPPRNCDVGTKAISKPCSCKYCTKRIECNESYLRYLHKGEKHICCYENQIKSKGENE